MDFFHFIISDDSEDYRVVLPSVLRGISVPNSCFLHCDVNGKPYRAEDFREVLARAGVLRDLACLGSFQTNHVLLAALKTTLAKRKLLAAGQLKVKDRSCYVLYPTEAQVQLKIHCVSHDSPDDTVRKALDGFGRVESVSRDVWHVEGFEGEETTTRIVRMRLSPEMSLESLPHQLNHAGGMALVVVPEQASLCFRCRSTGHVRENCRVPKCYGCHMFGHTRSECVWTCATAIVGASATPISDHVMDEVEEEVASATTRFQFGEEVRSPPEPACSSDLAREGGDDLLTNNDAVGAEAAAVVVVEPKLPSLVVQDGAPTTKPLPGPSGVAAKPANKAYKTARQRFSSTMSQESMDLGDQASLAAKRALELGVSPRSSMSLTEIGKVSHSKKGRQQPATNLPKEPRRKAFN